MAGVGDKSKNEENYTENLRLVVAGSELFSYDIKVIGLTVANKAIGIVPSWFRRSGAVTENLAMIPLD